MRNQIGIIVNALDAEAEEQATKGGIMGVQLHSMLCAIASRIQKAEADFARLHPSGQHVETRKPARPVEVDQPTGRFHDALTMQERDEARATIARIAQRLQTTTDPQTMLETITHLRRVEAERTRTDTHTDILPSGTGQQVQDIIARLMGERDEARAELEKSRSRVHNQGEFLKEIGNALGAEQIPPHGHTSSQCLQAIERLQSEVKDGAGLRKALTILQDRVTNQREMLTQIGDALGATKDGDGLHTSVACTQAARRLAEAGANAAIAANDHKQNAKRLQQALDMAEAACTAQAARADALQADADAAWNFAGIESDGMPTPEGPGRWGRIEEMTRRHVQAIRQWQARAERAEKALAADTLDIVRTFHGEAAKDGESLARYVARNVETLRAALRTVLLPLTLLTHHRGQFRPEDGLLDRLAKLAKRPQS